MAKYFSHESAIIDQGCEIGDDTKVWHFSHITTGAKIGTNCVFGQNVFVAKNVTIGNYCKIQNNVSLYEGTVLEDYVFCGPSCVFTNVKTPRCLFPRNTSADYTATVIKRGASIGANATIVCGITLHEHAFIAAGAVVTKDVPPFAIIAGTPGKIIGYMGISGDRLSFENNRAKDSLGNVYTMNDKTQWVTLESP